MRLPAMPVRSGRDATMNFDKLAKQTPTFVSELPSNPSDGQEVYYQGPFQNGIMSGQGVVWHLRYRAAAPSAHKWEYVGGPALFASAIANQFAASAEGATYKPLPISSPELITPPYPGRYDVAFGTESSQLQIAALAEFVLVTFFNATAIGAQNVTFSQQWNAAPMYRSFPIDIPGGSTKITLGYHVNINSTWQINTPYIYLLPRNIG